MPSYTVRIELHDASLEDRAALQRAMEEQGFKGTISSSLGGVCRLPSDEYDYDGPVTRANVLRMACEAARRLGRMFSVLVTESAGRTWYNLDPAA